MRSTIREFMERQSRWMRFLIVFASASCLSVGVAWALHGAPTAYTVTPALGTGFALGIAFAVRPHWLLRGKWRV